MATNTKPNQDERIWTDPLLASPHETADKANRVRWMFDAIAPRYELVNTVCSGGRDAAWRRAAVAAAQIRADDDVLDVACGTGDFARAFAQAGARRVVGCDFAHNMLCAARASTHPATSRCRWVEGDALRLPFRDGSFSATSCAFGVRNFADLDAGLGEMHRVLRSGGRAVILEFSRPKRSVVRVAYEFYSRRVMPRIATLMSGDRTGAYRYLPQSVITFLSPHEMCERLRAVGYSDVRARSLTFGVVTAYVARRS